MFQLVLVEHPSTCVRAWQSALLNGVNNSWTKEPTGMVPCGHFGMKWHAGEATELGDSHKHAIFFSSDHFHISKVNSGLADIPTSQYSWASSVPNHQVTSGVFQTVGVFCVLKKGSHHFLLLVAGGRLRWALIMELCPGGDAPWFMVQNTELTAARGGLKNAHENWGPSACAWEWDQPVPNSV